jgi:hypothetical protein
MTTLRSASRIDPQIRLLLFYLDQAFGRRGWHGPTLSAAVRDLSPGDAAWRPAPGRHSIWELVLHTAYWKYAVRRRLAPAESGRFSRSPANWPAVPEEPTARSLADDVALLANEHAKLVAVVRGFPPAKLHRKIAGTRFIPAEQIAGIAAHDLYHCGQIGLLKRLREDSHGVPRPGLAGGTSYF